MTSSIVNESKKRIYKFLKEYYGEQAREREREKRRGKEGEQY
jgi:hypothetical protein